MGNCIGRDPSRPPGVDAASVAGPVQYPAGLSSYMEACRLDLELQTFDTTIQRRTSRAIGSLVRGVEVNALSLGSFNEVTGCLLEMNQEVVKFILERKMDTWKDPELRILVDDYFENSLRTLDFYASLQKCLKRARDSQFIIEVALRRFTEEEAQEDVVKKYERTLEELKQFKAAGSPFTNEFFQELQSVYRQQLLMLEKLQLRKSKIDKKLKRIDAWKKVSSIIFVATVATVLICSIVAAAVAAPPVAAALAAAAAIPIGSMGKWIDSLFQDYINAWKGQEELITSMEARTVVTIMDLDSIRVLSDNLEIQIRSLLDNAEFALRDSEALKLGINEIMKKLELFMRSIQDLGEQADKCTRDIIRARTVVLNKIIKAPS